MRKYETFFILNPDLTEEIYSSASDKLKSIVTANGGSVISYVPWGKKKLAYPVKKHSQGLYVLMEYAGGPELVAELERNMRLDERVLKFITVKLADRYDPEKEASSDAAPRREFYEEEGEEEEEAELDESEALDEEEFEDEEEEEGEADRG